MRFIPLLDSIDAETPKILNANQKMLDMIGADHDTLTGKICQHFLCPAESGRCPITDLGLVIDSSQRILLWATGEKIPVLRSVTKTILDGKGIIIESLADLSDQQMIKRISWWRSLSLVKYLSGFLHPVRITRLSRDQMR